MSEEWIDSWLRRRTPPIPPVFLQQLLSGDPGPVSSLELARRGEEALEKALDRPGGDRDRAFHLLAADAFLTYACEAMARTEDVESGLAILLARLGTEFR